MSNNNVFTSGQTKSEPDERVFSSSSEDDYDYSQEPDEFSCHLCSSSFVTRVSLARHMILHEHNNNGSLLCSFCNQSFHREDDLAAHLSDHDEGDHSSGSFIAQRTQLSTEDQKDVKYDIGVDTKLNNNDDSIDMTSYLEEDDESLQDEDEVIVTIERIDDSENDIDMELDPTLNINASLNEISRKHQCKECGVSFLNQINLVRHMTIHSTNRPHKCQICAKGFVRKEHLTKHLSSVHSGMKFTCQFCGKDISRKDHLIRHIKNVHPVEYLGIPEEIPLNKIQDVNSAITLNMGYNSALDKAILSLQPQPKKPYLNCDMCDDIFTNLTTLYEHQGTVHSDVRRFKCEFCPKAFKRKEHLAKHSVLHTGEKAFSCLICGKEFPRKDALHDHTRRLHSSGYV